jgi:hypothetical protein
MMAAIEVLRCENPHGPVVYLGKEGSLEIALEFNEHVTVPFFQALYAGKMSPKWG